MRSASFAQRGASNVPGGGAVEGSVLFAGPGGAIDSDPGNFDYDSTLKTLSLGFNGNVAPVFSLRGDPAAPFPFSAAIYGPVFGGNVDPVLKWGFNVLTTGSRVDTARGQLTETFEGRYLGTQEWHLEGLTAAGGAKRWLTLQSNESTGYSIFSFLDTDALKFYATDTSDGGGSGGGIELYGSVSTSLKLKAGGGPYGSNGRPKIEALVSSQVLSVGVDDAGSALCRTRTQYDARTGIKQLVHTIAEPAGSEVQCWSWGFRGLVSIHGDYTTSTGNQTQNKACGQVRIANGNSSVTVTNNLCDTTNYKPVVFAMVQNGGGAAGVKYVDVNNGNFVINLLAPAAGTTVVAWWLFYVDA